LIGLILAAGRGTRMSPYTDAVPKEILPVADKPVIEYCLRYLGAAGVERIFVVLSNHKSPLIEYIKDGSWLNVHVAYLFQDMRLGTGTAKAVETAKPWVNEDFVVLYGDAFFHPGEFAGDMIRFHSEKGPSVTVGLYRVADPRAFGIAKISGDGVLSDLIERPRLGEVKGFEDDGFYLANSGPLVFKPEVFDYIEKTRPSPNGEYWITDTIRIMLREGCPALGYRIPRDVFWRDVGTPVARLEAEEYALRNMKNFNKGSKRHERKV